MAKYGVFSNAGRSPIQEFEGDIMEQDGAFVKIFKWSQVGDREQVGAAHLDKNQYVRKLDE